MRTACILAALTVCHMAARDARPADPEPPKPAAHTNSAGRVMVLQIKPGGHVELTGSIPEDVVARVDEARKSVAAAAEQARKSAEQIRQQADHAADATRAIHHQGTIVVVGPDGAAHTQTFSIDGGVPDLRFDIVKSLEAAGAVLREQDRARLRLAFQPVPPAPPVATNASAPPASALDAISVKLDHILERLQQLEHDVAALRSPQRSD